MSAQAFCAGLSSSAFSGAKRVMSSARPAAGIATSVARPQAASRLFIVSLPDDVRTSAAFLLLAADYSDRAQVQWGIGLDGSLQRSGWRRYGPGWLQLGLLVRPIVIGSAGSLRTNAHPSSLEEIAWLRYRYC